MMDDGCVLFWGDATNNGDVLRVRNDSILGRKKDTHMIHGIF